MADLSALVTDIYSVLDSETDHVVNEENLDAFANNLKQLMRDRLRADAKDRKVLRFSNLGKPDRQLWYGSRFEGEKLPAKANLKFLYGDIIEQILLLLAKEAGHSVTDEQTELEVDGVKGHTDAVIDGVTVDVKSASPYSYQKFENGSLFENDPFGYIGQISGYASQLTPETGGAFLACDKVSGDICVLRVGPSIVNSFDVPGKVAHQKKMLESDSVPPRCYPDQPDGKSGNRKLGTECSYCAFKKICWNDANNGKGLRLFLYSGKPRWLTEVSRVPDVIEIKDD